MAASSSALSLELSELLLATLSPLVVLSLLLEPSLPEVASSLLPLFLEDAELLDDDNFGFREDELDAFDKLDFDFDVDLDDEVPDELVDPLTELLALALLVFIFVEFLVVFVVFPVSLEVVLYFASIILRVSFAFFANSSFISILRNSWFVASSAADPKNIAESTGALTAAPSTSTTRI